MAGQGSLQVELVAAESLVWSGEASKVSARTVDGDIGILPGHAPLLSVLQTGVVDVTTTSGETWVAAVNGGFISVAAGRVSILSEIAEMSHDIDLEKARKDLERLHAAGESEDAAVAAVAMAEARIRAKEQAS